MRKSGVELLKKNKTKKIFKNLIQGQTPPTAPLPIVDRLKGTPYSRPYRSNVEHDEQARFALEFGLDVAEVMLRYGGGALEVETTLIAIATSAGLDDVDIDITNQSVILNYAPEGEIPVTLLRVTRSWSRNFSGLSQVHNLVTEIVSGKTNLRVAKKRLEEIETRPKSYARWVVIFSYGVLAASLVILLGGSWVGALVGFWTCAFNDYIGRLMGKRRLPNFFIVCSGTIFATMTAFFVRWLEVPVQPALVVAAGIIALLPSARLVSAVQDAIQGFPVTAAGRLLSVFITVGALVSGISIGLVGHRVFGITDIDVIFPENPEVDVWLRLLMVCLITVAVAITEQSGRRILLPTAFVAFLGYSVFLYAQFLGLEFKFSPAVGAVVVGFVAKLVANRMNIPHFVLAVPAIVPFLPGLLIFRSMYDITNSSPESLDGFAGLLTAFGIALGVAAGVVFGDYIARPFERYVVSLDEVAVYRR